MRNDNIELRPRFDIDADMAAVAVSADDKTLRMRLRKAIDAATRTRGFVEYHEAAGWAANAHAALDAFADLASGTRANLALELAERAIDRVERAIGEIDDSDGHSTALLERVRDIHFAAAETTKPEPIQFARDLFAREVHGSYGTFSGAVTLYAEILGDVGLAEYHRLAAEAWENLSRHKAGSVEAVKLIARMAGLRGAAEHAAYVAVFKERYGRKRNLMKLLG